MLAPRGGVIAGKNTTNNLLPVNYFLCALPTAWRHKQVGDDLTSTKTLQPKADMFIKKSVYPQPSDLTWFLNATINFLRFWKAWIQFMDDYGSATNHYIIQMYSCFWGTKYLTKIQSQVSSSIWMS